MRRPFFPTARALAAALAVAVTAAAGPAGESAVPDGPREYIQALSPGGHPGSYGNGRAAMVTLPNERTAVEMRFGGVNQEWFAAHFAALRGRPGAVAIGLAFKGDGMRPRDAWFSIQTADGKYQAKRNLNTAFDTTTWQDLVFAPEDFEYKDKDPAGKPAVPNLATVSRYDLTCVGPLMETTSVATLGPAFVVAPDAKGSAQTVGAAAMGEAGPPPAAASEWLGILTRPAGDAPATAVAKWRDDKAGAFVMTFDDGLNSQLDNVLPRLRKHGFTGTFFFYPGAGHLNKARWEKEFPGNGFAVGNHTLNHQTMTPENYDREIGGAQEWLLKLDPARAGKLVAFARPGLKEGQWTISEDQLREALARHRLVMRDDPGFFGAAIHVKGAGPLRALVDEAVAGRALKRVDFHGVGGDWISVPTGDFQALLDKLVREAANIWIADYLSAHQYARERDAAKVDAKRAGDRITVTLTAAGLDPALYDLPLTLVTKAPDGWTGARVAQGGRTAEVQVEQGFLRYSAIPNAGPATLTGIVR